jgi:hypothetical protein
MRSGSIDNSARRCFDYDARGEEGLNAKAAEQKASEIKRLASQVAALSAVSVVAEEQAAANQPEPWQL